MATGESSIFTAAEFGAEMVGMEDMSLAVRMEVDFEYKEAADLECSKGVIAGVTRCCALVGFFRVLMEDFGDVPAVVDGINGET